MKLKLFFFPILFCVILTPNSFSQTWHQHRGGIPPGYTYGGSTTTVLGDGANIYAANISSYSDSGIFYAPNSSTLFTPGICVKAGQHDVAQFAKYAGKVFLGLANGLHASSDSGHTWPFIAAQPSANPHTTFLYASNDTMYAAIRGQGIYRTIDSAASWLLLGNTGLDTEILGLVRINGTIYTAGKTNLQYSTDDGTSWHNVPITPEMTIAWYPDRIITMDTSIFVSTGYGLYRSDDYGTHWARKYSFGTGAIAEIDNYLLMATITAPVKVKVSRDRGETFVDMSTGLYINLGSQIVNFSYSDSDIMLGIGSGCPCVDSTIFNLRRSDLVLPFASSLQIKELTHNSISVFPNPAIDKFTITLKETAAELNVQITDLSGRLLRAVQFHNVCCADVPINDISSGLYLVNVSDGDSKSTCKLVVAR